VIGAIAILCVHPRGLALTPLVVYRIIDICVHACFLIMESSRRFSTCLGPIGIQWYAIVVATYMQAEALWFSDYGLARLLQAFGIATDIVVEPQTYMYPNFILYLLTLTCIAFSSPLRWCLLAPLGFTGIAWFIVGTMSFPDVETQPSLVLTQVILLTGLIAGLCTSKFTSERTEREVFVRMTSEKVLRYTVEREMEAAKGSSGAGVVAPSARSERASTAATDVTSKIFASFRGSEADMTNALQSLANLGHAEHWAIEVDDLAIDTPRDKVLGAGGFGFVIQASYHGAPVALKAARHPHSAKRGQAEALAQELRAFRHLRHPNLVLFYGACVDNDSCELMLVLEYVPGLCLAIVAQKPISKFGILDRSKMIYGVACALTYLHTREPAIIHGDVKSDNVIVEFRPGGEVRSRVLDFGLSRLLTKTTRPLGGTQLWMAPEVRMRTAIPSTSTDVYSFAWVLFNAMTGFHPSAVVTSESLQEAWAYESAPSLTWPPGISWPEGSEHLCASCMRFDAAARPFMDEARTICGNWCGKVRDPENSPTIAEVLKSVREMSEEKPAQHAATPIVDGQASPFRRL